MNSRAHRIIDYLYIGFIISLCLNAVVEAGVIIGAKLYAKKADEYENVAFSLARNEPFKSQKFLDLASERRVKSNKLLEILEYSPLSVIRESL